MIVIVIVTACLVCGAEEGGGVAVSGRRIGKSPCIGQLTRVEVVLVNRSERRIDRLRRLEAAIRDISVSFQGEGGKSVIDNIGEVYGGEAGSRIEQGQEKWWSHPVDLGPRESMRLSFPLGNFWKAHLWDGPDPLFQKSGRYVVRVKLEPFYDKPDVLEVSIDIPVLPPTSKEQAIINLVGENGRRRIALLSTRDEVEAVSNLKCN